MTKFHRSQSTKPSFSRNFWVLKWKFGRFQEIFLQREIQKMRSFVFHKTRRNFSKSHANRLLRPDSERTRSQLSESGLRIVLAILSRKLEIFAKKRSFYVQDPLHTVTRSHGHTADLDTSHTMCIIRDKILTRISLISAIDRLIISKSVPL